jgi:hypothetical protein
MCDYCRDLSTGTSVKWLITPKPGFIFVYNICSYNFTGMSMGSLSSISDNTNIYQTGKMGAQFIVGHVFHIIHNGLTV